MTAAGAIALTVNGEAVTVGVKPGLNLADFLRDHLGLTGTRVVLVRSPCTQALDVAPAMAMSGAIVVVTGREIAAVVASSRALAEDAAEMVRGHDHRNPVDATPCSVSVGTDLIIHAIRTTPTNIANGATA